MKGFRARLSSDRMTSAYWQITAGSPFPTIHRTNR